MKSKRFLSLFLIFVICIFPACNLQNTSTSNIAQVTISENAVEPVTIPSKTENTSKSTEPVEEVFEEYDITLMAVGDNLMHMGVINAGKQKDGTYNYDFLFDGISRYLEDADIKIINQETILAGNEFGFSGYPYFNSPTEVADSIVNAGFNVVLHSSNHTADMGFEGLINCASYWEKYPEVLTVGIYKEPTPEPDIPLLTIKDVTFAILNYTYGPNMEIFPEDLDLHMNFLCNFDEATNRLDFTTINPRVLEDIKKAETLADIVIVCPHWGTEYTTKPSIYQEKWALQMTEAGADLIIGTHPHVIQPIEWVEAENGNQSLCYYSLGNYASTQKQSLCMLEALAWVTFHVTEDGVILSEDSIGAIPLVCHYTSAPVRMNYVYTLEEYTEELAMEHGIWSYGDVPIYLDELQEWSKEILGEWILPVQ